MGYSCRLTDPSSSPSLLLCLLSLCLAEALLTQYEDISNECFDGAEDAMDLLRWHGKVFGALGGR